LELFLTFSRIIDFRKESGVTDNITEKKLRTDTKIYYDDTDYPSFLAGFEGIWKVAS
jgi:hypothetical protein